MIQKTRVHRSDGLSVNNTIEYFMPIQSKQNQTLKAVSFM
jgi:hypothetical protein